MPKKSTTPLTKEQLDIILGHLNHAMFFAHAADNCGDDYEIQLTADPEESLRARAAIAHVGYILMRCAEDLGVPAAQRDACSKEALERAKARAPAPKHQRTTTQPVIDPALLDPKAKA
ncbi:hypothetical protein [Hyalangium rubrum]|uniref:Uncharacterized protein n=1 Tax=Hyalangium rubrum TaxID=3103134 RepID=A0ABU5H1U7_9BACT|nr:hypothetical protein [Hyalangium sp. s54d21]MDY7227370.1 hypothetical protein [Hyalangium sp. s54d21]